MKVTKLEINDVLNIRNADLDLSDGRALIVGPNGCGKTNIIKCIVDIFDDIKQGAQNTGQSFFLCENMQPLCNRELEDDDSFIKLGFNVKESEREMFIKLRMNSLIHKVHCLCRLLVNNTEESRKLEDSFLKESVPKLCKLTKTSCDSRGQWQKSSSCADVTITKIYPKDRPCERISYYRTELKVEMPDKKKEETKIISDFLKKKLNGNVLQKKKLKSNVPQKKKLKSDVPQKKKSKRNVLKKTFLLQRNRQEEKDLKVIDIINDIVSHEEFFRSECTHGGTAVSDIYTPSRRFISGSYTFDEKYQGQPLSQIVCCLLNGTICILPQSRGFSKDEEGDLFWNLDKAEKKIVESYLWEEGSDEWSRLNKVKEAMLFIAGLELDVAKHPSRKYNAEAREGCVILRECNKSQAEWRKLYQVSGGQRELLMVLSAIHLSNADNVFLDEPGHSLHPSKQTQLRRWFEIKSEPNQVLFAITHSIDMISPYWLGVLYHMFPDGDRYSAACFQKLPQNVDGDDLGASASHQTSSEGLQEVLFASTDSTDMINPHWLGVLCHMFPDGDQNVDDDDLGASASHQTSSEGLQEIPIQLAPDMIDFMMSMELRRLFFSCGVVFVEGDTDKRVIQALRVVELEKVDKTLKDLECSIKDWNNAHKETQMDRWDIIPINGSANWLKAYRAAEDLKIPFIVVLDADVLNQKCGPVISPITYEDFISSRLNVLIRKSGYDANHPLKKMVVNVVKLVNDTDVQDKEIQVRKEIKKCHLWVWSDGDLENLFFMDERVKEKLAENEQFIEMMEELQVSHPDKPTSGRSQMPEFDAKNSFDAVCSFFLNEIEEMKKELQTTYDKLQEAPRDTEVVENLSNNCTKKMGKVKQKLQNHITFVKKGTTRETEAAPEETARKLKQYWQNVKRKLHDGSNWKRISFELLKEMVEIAIDEEDNPLHKLWEEIKSTMINRDTKARIPSFLIQEKFNSMLP